LAQVCKVPASSVVQSAVAASLLALTVIGRFPRALFFKMATVAVSGLAASTWTAVARAALGRRGFMALRDQESRVGQNAVQQLLTGPVSIFGAAAAAAWYFNSPTDKDGNLKQTGVCINIFGPNMPL